MADIAWPTGIAPISTGLESMPNVKAFESPENGTVTTAEWPGHKWRQTLSLPDLSGDERIDMQVFLLQLQGQKNRVLLPDFAYRRRGPGGGTPVVSGGSQTGRSLLTSGWTPSLLVLRRGDYFSLPNYELLRLVSDATSNGSGVATLTFEPEIRVSPSNGAAIEINATRARFMLNTRTASWTNTARVLDGHYVRSGFTIDFIEAYP